MKRNIEAAMSLPVTSGVVGDNMEKWGRKGDQCLLLNNVWRHLKCVSHISFRPQWQDSEPHCRKSPVHFESHLEVKGWCVRPWFDKHQPLGKHRWPGSACAAQGMALSQPRQTPGRQAEQSRASATASHRAQLDQMSFPEISVDVSFFHFSAALW